MIRHRTVTASFALENLGVSARIRVGAACPCELTANSGVFGDVVFVVNGQNQCHRTVTASFALENLGVRAGIRVGAVPPSVRTTSRLYVRDAGVNGVHRDGHGTEIAAATVVVDDGCIESVDRIRNRHGLRI